MPKFLDVLLLREPRPHEPAAPASPAPPPPAAAAPAPADAGQAEGTVSREPALVPLYNPAGDALYVAPADVAKWLALGFRLTRSDLRAEVDALGARFDAAHRALDALVRATEDHGVIQPADTATAQAAVSDLAGALARILGDAHVAYAVAEPAPVAMRDPDGQPHDVDPNQVAQYRALGWTEVAA